GSTANCALTWMMPKCPGVGCLPSSSIAAEPWWCASKTSGWRCCQGRRETRRGLRSRLLDLALDRREHGTDVRAENRQDRHRGSGNKHNQKTVFDHGGALFFLEKELRVQLA